MQNKKKQQTFAYIFTVWYIDILCECLLFIKLQNYKLQKV